MNSLLVSQWSYGPFVQRVGRDKSFKICAVYNLEYFPTGQLTFEDY